MSGSGSAPPLVLAERDAESNAVGLVRLNDPGTSNALSAPLMAELLAQVEQWDGDESVNCIVIAGSDAVFSAGGDVRALHDQDASDTSDGSSWSRMAACRTPLVAAISGYALGGGLELALLCDLVVAAERSELGQPEIMLGLIPGAGGTQRLARTVGKQRAMELVLTGRRISASEAERIGLVNQVASRRRWLDDALALARTVAQRAPVAARLAKQAVLAAEEMALSAGLEEERRLYEHALATEDRLEGTSAFLERRSPRFRGR